jgi:hypothetical protein
MVLWLFTIKISFLSEFKSGPGLLLATTVTVLDLGVAMHYFIFKRYDQVKNPLRFI